MGKGYEGFDAMYTGLPSKPGKTQVQIGYGLVKGDGVGFEDVANSKQTGKISYGAADGKRKKSNDDLEQG
jgi:hypothetical protein